MNIFRFKDGFKKKVPYNALCFLDPRNVDLYFTHPEQMEFVRKVIIEDNVFYELRNKDVQEMDQETGDKRLGGVGEPAAAEPSNRKAILLAKRKLTQKEPSVSERIDEEIER